MTEAETIWIAGILEGEGSFSFHLTQSPKRKRKLRIRLSMTDIDIIVRARNIIHPNGNFRRDERSVQSFKDGYKRKDTYILTVEGGSAATVMRTILPYMGSRRSERINECLRLWEETRRGPAYQPPTAEERADALARVKDMGL